MAQLAEWPLPTPGVSSSNPVIGQNLHWTFVYCQLYWKDKNNKKGREWPILKTSKIIQTITRAVGNWLQTTILDVKPRKRLWANQVSLRHGSICPNFSIPTSAASSWLTYSWQTINNRERERGRETFRQAWSSNPLLKPGTSAAKLILP